MNGKWLRKLRNNRAVAYYQKQDFDKAWADIEKAQSLGFKAKPEFVKALRQAAEKKK